MVHLVNLTSLWVMRLSCFMNSVTHQCTDGLVHRHSGEHLTRSSECRSSPPFVLHGMVNARYLYSSCVRADSVMRSKVGGLTQQLLLERHNNSLTDVLDALNVLSATAWRINNRV